MALTACAECGRQISKKATVCPNCGFKPKRTSFFTWFVAIFVAVPMLISVFISAGTSGSTSSQASTTQTQSNKTPEQLAVELEKEALKQLAFLGAQTLKESMRNPDSFKLESAIAVNTTNAVCYEYRAQNGFGGTNVESAVLTGSGDFVTSSMESFHSAWNKNCAGQRGTDWARYIW